MSDEMRECREAFETWAKSIGYSLRRGRKNGYYVDSDTFITWGSWQAAWNTRPSAGPDEGLALDIAGIIEGYKCEQWTSDRALEMARHIIEFTALRRPQPSAWRPIETAPKDGSYILLYPPMTELNTPYEPTHWQPLPAPPAEGDVN